MSLREQKRTQRQAVILRAARDAFKEKGIEASKMEEIAKAANVSPGTLYNYFPSKDELVRSLTELYRADASQERKSIVENPELAPHQAFSELYRVWIDSADQYLCRDVWRHGQMAGLTSNQVEARQAAWLNEQNLIEVQRNLLLFHIKLGNLPQDLNTEDWANSLHAIGFYWWMYYLGNEQVESEYSKQRISDQFKTLFNCLTARP